MAISRYLDYIQNGSNLIIFAKFIEDFEKMKVVVNLELIEEN